jgi:peptide/nickel transport system substrate-binding protein
MQGSRSRSPIFRIVALLVVIVVAGLAGCSKQGASYVVPGTLRIGVPITPTQLNPILAQNSVENFLAGLMFSELVTVDAQGHEIPDLAAVVPTVDNGGISKDGLTITYHLRRGVTWHDGAPFTSKDVLFTWHAIMNPNNNAVAHTGYNLIARMDTPDDYTVVMHMKKLYSPAIDTIFGESDTPYRILPAHILARYPSINSVPFNSNPVGTGPFKFVRWLRGDRIVLVANPQYFLGKPKLHSIVVKIIPDQNTTEAQVRTHEIDLALEMTGTNYRSLADDPDVHRLIEVGPNFFAIFFNTTHPPLDDVRVRRALALALDRQAITSNNTYGTGIEATADLSPYYWAFDRSLKPLPYDPKQAAALLDAAGWHLGPNGVRMKNGHPLELQLSFGNGSSLVRNVTAQVQQMLKQVGVSVSLRGYDYALLYAAAQDGGVYNSGKFDLAMYSWIAGADPDDSNTWLSTNVPPAGNNVTRYDSKQMDAAQNIALSTFDRATRAKAYAAIEKTLLHDVPGTFIYYQGRRFAYTPEFQGFAPNGVSEGWNAYQWSI